MKILLNNKQVPIKRDSFSMNDVIEERSTCSFVAVDIDNVNRYTRGTPVKVENEVGKVIFSGFVEKVSEEKITGTKGLYHKVDCIDNHYLADKRIIADAWKGKKAGSVIKQIVKDYLAIEGVSSVPDTNYPTIAPIFNTSKNPDALINDVDRNGFSELQIPIGSPRSVVPLLSTNNEGKGWVVSSNISSSSTAYRVFDGVSRNGQVGTVLPEKGGWVQLDFPSGFKLDYVTLIIDPTQSVHVPQITQFELLAFDGTEWFVVNNHAGLNWSMYGDKYDIRISDVPPFHTKNLREKTYTKIKFINNSSTPRQFTELRVYEQAKLSETSVTVLSEPFYIRNWKKFEEATISWKETLSPYTSVEVYTSIDNIRWFQEENGGDLQSLYLTGRIGDINADYLYVKVVLNSTILQNKSPIIEDVKIDITEKIGSIQPSNLLDEAVFNYIPISEALNSIAEQTESWWKIDADKKLHFGSRELYTAPFKVNSMNIIKNSLKVNYGNNEYRNQQYIIGGKDVTDIQTEQFSGNTLQRTFTTAYPIHEVPLIYIDGIKVERVGIRGLSKAEDGYEWFWSKGSNIINQDEDAIPLHMNQTLKVEYKGLFDVVVMTRTASEVARLRELENNSGFVEHVREEKTISSRDNGFKFASKVLDKYGKIGREIRFKTHVEGLESGQLVTVNFPTHKLINEELLIESVTLTYESDMFFYDIKAIQNTVSESWTKFFYKLGTQGRSYVIRENIAENEILTTLEMFFKTWIEDENPNIFRQNYPSNKNMPKSNNYPSFAEEDRVKYVAWFNENIELGRKQITKQTWDETTQELLSIVYLSATEANTKITHFGWFGGESAIDLKGTGILIDKQVFTKEKNELEALEIDRIDKKGW